MSLRSRTATREDPLSIIEEEARAMALCFGVPEADCAEAAALMARRVQARLGPGSVYFAARSARDRERIHAAIRLAFDGTNVNELAREHRLTPRGVRRILQAGRAEQIL